MSIRPLSAALLKKAEEEVHETPSRITSSLKILREWLCQQPHLHSIKPTDQWLVAFLRGCKYDMEKTKKKVDAYYTLKATVPDFYENRDPLDPGIQEILKLGVILPLKNCMHDDSPRILLARSGLYSQTAGKLTDLIKVALMIVEILLLEDDNFTIAGEDVIVDLQDLAFGLIWQWTPSMARKVMSCAEKALSVRLKNMHILNGPFFLGPAVRIFKMLCSPKLKSRIHLQTKDFNTLYDHIDKSVLPKEYGGTNGTLQDLIDYWKSKVESRRQWFIEENVCSDESVRCNNSSVEQPLQSLEID